jgi:hypothetical protein
MKESKPKSLKVNINSEIFLPGVEEKKAIKL